MAVRIVSAHRSGRKARLTFRAKSQVLANEGTEVFMPDFAGDLGASKAASALLVLFIPSKDRRNKADVGKADPSEPRREQNPAGRKSQDTAQPDA